jgi:hypothetical protein
MKFLFFYLSKDFWTISIITIHKKVKFSLKLKILHSKYKMVRICKSEGCEEICEYKKQYCLMHRRNYRQRAGGELRNNIVTPHVFETQNTISQEQIKIDRELRHQQELEFQETQRLDMQKIQETNEALFFEKEIEDAIKLSIETEKNERKSKLQDIDSIDISNCLKIKFKIPNSQFVNRNFHNESTFEDLRNFLDFYFFENKIEVESYNIVSNFPKKVFSTDFNTSKIIDHISLKNIVLYIAEI